MAKQDSDPRDHEESSQRAELLPDLLTSERVARYLGISASAFYQLRYRHGGPPAVRIYGSLRFRREDLLDWITSELESG